MVLSPPPGSLIHLSPWEAHAEAMPGTVGVKLWCTHKSMNLFPVKNHLAFSYLEITIFVQFESVTQILNVIRVFVFNLHQLSLKIRL